MKEDLVLRLQKRADEKRRFVSWDRSADLLDEAAAAIELLRRDLHNCQLSRNQLAKRLK